MFAVMGVTGQVGGVVVRSLLAARRPVRAIVRDIRKGAVWSQLGCEIAVADTADVDALAHALGGATGAFVMLPPNFAPSPGFPEARKLVAALREALARARPGKIVALSTIGAQAPYENLLTPLRLLEDALGTLDLPVTFLRPGWFMENTAWDVAPARATGAVPSYLQPLDRAVPMVAVADVGRTVAELLQDDDRSHRVVELEGPTRTSPADIASALAAALGSPVRPEIVPRETWPEQFIAQGAVDPTPRIRMLDGFNEGWIAFENEAAVRHGRVPLADVVRALVTREEAALL